MGDPKVTLARRVEVHVHVAPRVDDRGNAGRLIGDQGRQMAEALDLELPDVHDREVSTGAADTRTKATPDAHYRS
jgi:hypothetical protein